MDAMKKLFLVICAMLCCVTFADEAPRIQAKDMPREWWEALEAKGEPEAYSGSDLETIAMPCGGIGTGQVYLSGDGRLVSWRVFNNPSSNWFEQTNSTFQRYVPDQPIAQGFALALTYPDGKKELRTLDSKGFVDVRFRGEYPVGRVTFSDPMCPVTVELTAFSPFIPLNAEDSGFPATIMSYTINKTGDQPVKAAIVGWIENAAHHHTAGQFRGKRTVDFASDVPARLDAQPVAGLAYMAAQALSTEESHEVAPPNVIAAFEDGFEGWTVEGTAFGDKPAKGGLPAQQEVTNYEGEGLVNSFHGGDAGTGRMLSEPFTIDRYFLNLKVGGGAKPAFSHVGDQSVKLYVDGKEVLEARGNSTERLSWNSWYVAPWYGHEARIEIVDQNTQGWGHILVDQIELDDRPQAKVQDAMSRAPDAGSIALLSLDGLGDAAMWKAEVAKATQLPEDKILVADAKWPIAESGYALVASPAKTIDSPVTNTFAVAWYFPNLEQGRYYQNRFDNAGEVARHIALHYDRLAHDTLLWRGTYYDSTLPWWLLDRLHSTASYLATGTSQWWKNGRFWAFEGVACCAGTCTHVWNYAHAHARLFPSIARSIRSMQDLEPRNREGGFHPDSGLVGFRGGDAYAADGQCGTVLKAWREHLCSPDNTFLLRYWPRIRKVLEYSIAQDGNFDGLIENSQHNTYDINYYGANTMVGSLYLAALRAGEEMARIVGDDQFAAHCRTIYESGARLSMQRLWNGEFFIQDVDLEKHPMHQYGPGCLSDQMFGQGWAHQVGLGYIYPEASVKSALNAVWKYNWAANVSEYNKYHPAWRPFIQEGMPGLLTCTWPNSEYLSNGTVYRNEIWTGIEYQVANHMAYEGMVREALAICRAIHDRYQPGFLNPYNEIECGDHYARAMASWGVLTSLQGFEYDGPAGHIAFNPRISPDNFRSAFTAAEGWGTFEQTRDGDDQWDRLRVRWGQVRLNSLAFAVPQGTEAGRVRVYLDDERIDARVQRGGERVHIALERPVQLQAQEELSVLIDMD